MADIFIARITDPQIPEVSIALNSPVILETALASESEIDDHMDRLKGAIDIAGARAKALLAGQRTRPLTERPGRL